MLYVHMPIFMTKGKQHFYFFYPYYPFKNVIVSHFSSLAHKRKQLNTKIKNVALSVDTKHD